MGFGAWYLKFTILSMRKIVIVAHNLRSSHNVGSLLRTADGLGVNNVFLTGYTPYPSMKKDVRLAHIANKVNHQISKTALGAEKSVNWANSPAIEPILEELKRSGYQICALEQGSKSINLVNFNPPNMVALILGRETEGIEPEILKLADKQLEIPMLGKKESFNVVQAAAMAIYHLLYFKV